MKIFKKEYRIVTDSYVGHEAETKGVYGDGGENNNNPVTQQPTTKVMGVCKMIYVSTRIQLEDSLEMDVISQIEMWSDDGEYKLSVNKIIRDREYDVKYNVDQQKVTYMGIKLGYKELKELSNVLKTIGVNLEARIEDKVKLALTDCVIESIIRSV